MKQVAVVSPTKGGRKKKEEEQAEVWKWYVVIFST